ncbi:type I polyketide synthase [Saccharopolyspora sp. NPDC003752]
MSELTGSPARERNGLEIAIIGMAGRFPGAPSPAHLWERVLAGCPAVSRFNSNDAAAEGLNADLLTERADYAPYGAVLDDVEMFDAEFFGMSPREAEQTDPQQRLLLECAWEALEDAGYDTHRLPGLMGVYAGVGSSTYRQMLPSHPEDGLGSARDYQLSIGNDADFAATRIAYRMDLTGPALTVQTACSTSLVAVHLAVQGLLAGDCDLALAGGASIRLPHRAGYLVQPGGILSPDGRCRPFAAAANGTVIGSGAGAVVLRRLQDAVDDGDHIYAVVLGSAINNDGSQKLSFTAPSVSGQEAVILAAQAAARVGPDSIEYVETHGTGTALGDQMEFDALARAFRSGTRRTGFCWLGAVKSVVGHLDAASGITGLTVASQALHRGVIPPARHVDQPHSGLHLESSPFRLPSEPVDWPRSGRPRRAAVSSFGLGGTNAHVVLEEAPAVAGADERTARTSELLIVSARTQDMLGTSLRALSGALTARPDLCLDDVSFTLANGRRQMPYRWSAVCRDTSSAASAAAAAVGMSGPAREEPRLAFLLPGIGAQRKGMAQQLYAAEPRFRARMDQCARLLAADAGMDLLAALYPAGDASSSLDRLDQGTAALFSVQYALGTLLESWGVQPAALLGHSLGECVAACLAGVMSLRDGLRLAVLRGHLFERAPGAMVVVPLSEQSLIPLLPPGTAVATIAGPERCVASGPTAQISQLMETLANQGMRCRLVPVRAALHSPAIGNAADEFGEFMSSVSLQEPRKPYISNVTGTWVTAKQATDAAYWATQMRSTVQLSDGFALLARTGHNLFVELGPGYTMSTWAQQHQALRGQATALPTLGDVANHDALEQLQETVGRLWQRGVSIDWQEYFQGRHRRRVSLPGHPFERQRHSVTRRVRSMPANTTPRPAVSPRAQTEEEPSPMAAAFRQQWRETLGIDQIGLDDDFFALGGDSLLAVELAARLSKLTSTVIHPSGLLNASTLREQLGVFSGHRAEPGHLTLIRAAAQAPEESVPLYLVHPIGGEVIAYADLAAALDWSAPIFGFAANDQADNADQRWTLEAIAERYAQELRSAQSATGYVLGGSSFGGVVAVEMARLMHSYGNPPLVTVLLDSPWPADIPLAHATSDAQLARLTGVSLPVVRAKLRGLRGERRRQRRLQLAQQARAVPAHVTVREFAQYLDRLAGRAESLRSYRPQGYSGEVVYFQAAGSVHLGETSADRWAHALPRLRVLAASGGHESMLHPPHVSGLAVDLRRAVPTHQDWGAMKGADG